MEGVVATSAPQLENGTGRRLGRAQQGGCECGLLDVLLGRGDQGPPRCEIGVEAVSRYGVTIIMLVSRLGHTCPPNDLRHSFVIARAIALIIPCLPPSLAGNRCAPIGTN